MKERIIDFIRQTSKVMQTGGGVVGLSGGVDSSVCAALLCEALGSDKCLGIIIPANDSNPKDASDALEVARCLKMSIVLHPMKLEDFEFPKRDFEKEVKPLLLAMDELLPSEIELPYIMKLRGRMLIITYYAKRYNMLQCQTLEKTEWMLGWFDKFGDAAGDIAPIRHLYKTEVYGLAGEYVKKGILPPLVLRRQPGSGNYPMTDYEELGGLSFDETEEILNMIDLPASAIAEHLGIEKNKILKIEHLVSISESKRMIPLMLDRIL